jgi:hypothetical protein
MPDRTDPMKDYDDAMEREHQAWEALQCRPPGTRRFSRVLWAAWVDAVSAMNLEAERYLKAESDLSGSAQRSSMNVWVPPSTASWPQSLHRRGRRALQQPLGEVAPSA